jgi:AcrR family transcriptional regulator
MTAGDKQGRRVYRAPQRAAAASRTRRAVVHAARKLFEERGWAATTIRAIAEQADVSQKTVEALFGTKGALLRAAVEYAIRGDIDPLPMPQREAIARIERAATAVEMLDLHASHLHGVNERSARIAWVVEQAAAGDPVVEALWAQMNRNRTFAVQWATGLLLAKPGRRRGLRRRDVEAAFWVALDWATYRTLSDHAQLEGDRYEAWLRSYYRLMFLPH